MKILALDTATEACSVALYHNGETLAQIAYCPQQQSQQLLPMVQALLGEAQTTLTQLDYLAFTRGPGSFTGVRIAVSMAQGLAFGADLPVIGISTLAALAQQAISEAGEQQVAVALDARMGELYFARFNEQAGLASLLGEEQVISPHVALAQCQTGDCGVGSGWPAYPELATKLHTLPELTYPNAQYILPLAIQAIKQGQAVSAELAQPVYVRDTVTWKKLPGR